VTLKDYDILTLDVPTAYLGCPLAEEIYMRHPDGPWTKTDPYGHSSPLVQLEKTLYGAHQANREWAKEVFDFAIDDDGLHLTVSKASPGLFFYGIHGKSPIYLLIYVDDLMLIGPMTSISALSHQLAVRFKAAGPPPSNSFQYLGMTITRDRTERSIHIDQAGYIEKVFERFGMAESSPVSTPLDPGTCLQAITAADTPADINVYQQAVGALLYAALRTRPDIAYAVSVLGRYAAKPSSTHWMAVKHLLHYLPGTRSLQLTISSTSCNLRPGIVAYTNADLGGDVDTCKSMSGLVKFVEGILVHWKSRKQTLVAQSTIPAELITTATTKQVCEGLYDIASELGHRPTITIINDNLNCVMTLKSGNFQANCRHLHLRY
jgi:hypothetical protein